MDDHFRGKPPALRELFDHLVEKVGQFGPVRVDPVKTAINLSHTTHFSMVYTRSDSLLVEFFSDHAIEDPRVSKMENLGEHGFLHYARISRKEDLDDSFMMWMKAAHEAAA